ncbi:hypothetical protein EG329_000291 [Mollisiaceae sp. DMI_Dod_QoI]|nr:hypothetical protein EG329_000291 [Helotiales sp. DMI_Dod_QoI]
MGFPSSGSSKIHKLASLTPESRRKIERKIFGPVPTDEVIWWNEQRDKLCVACDSTFLPAYLSDSEDDFHPSQIEEINLQSLAIQVPQKAPYKVSLKWEDLAVVINSRTLPETKEKESDGDKSYMRASVSVNVVQQYISLICLYANRVRARAERTDKETQTTAQDDANAQEKTNKTKITKTKIPRRVSCKFLTIAQFRQIEVAVKNKDQELSGDIRGILSAKRITKENFQTLDFLFIPYIDKCNGHYMLLGFAPKQRYMFLVDSSDMQQINLEANLRNTLLAILNYLVPEEADRERWDINFSYTAAEEKSERKAILQRDAYNCGIYTCTNALLLAFGYSLTCYTAREIDQFRKPRMVAEFRNGGFSGLYKYDLIELPPPSENTGPTHSYAAAIQAQKDEEAKMMSDDDTSPDDHETFGLDDTTMIGSSTTTTTVAQQGSTLSTKVIFPTATECLVKDIASGKVRPESLDRPMAAQFSPSTHKRNRIMYAFPHINFKEAMECSKEEMIQACKNFPITNWEQWSAQPKDFFLRWMMSEMGATMARIHQDPIQPFAGLGDWYEIWLKWQAEGQEMKIISKVVAKAKKDVKATKQEVSLPPVLRTSPRRAVRSRPTEDIAVIGDAEDTIVVDSSEQPTRKRKRQRRSK